MGDGAARFPPPRPPSLPESIASLDSSGPMCKGRLDLCVCNRNVARRDKVSNALVYAQGETGAMRPRGEAEVGSTDASLLRRPPFLMVGQSRTIRRRGRDDRQAGLASWRRLERSTLS